MPIAVTFPYKEENLVNPPLLAESANQEIGPTIIWKYIDRQKNTESAKYKEINFLNFIWLSINKGEINPNKGVRISLGQVEINSFVVILKVEINPI